MMPFNITGYVLIRVPFQQVEGGCDEDDAVERVIDRLEREHGNVDEIVIDDIAIEQTHHISNDEAEVI
jgi:hypothetical protein